MHPIAKLTQHLKARTDSEHEQALLRLVIVGLFLAYMTLFHDWSTAGPLNQDVIVLLSSFFVVGLVLFATICIWPAANVPRRLIGMLADNAGATWYICLAGEYGFSMIGVLLFVAFGNGFRYGRQYLFASQALSVAGFAGVLVFVPYWSHHQAAGIGLLIALVVLPLYVSTLLARIQDARARAEEANLAKTSFLANMSHEIRTPLNGITGVVDLLQTTTLSPQQSELVGLLRHSASVLRSLVDDVLDITKIEAGRVTIEVAAFDLHVCINSLMQLLRPHAQAKGLSLTAVVDPALDYRLKGDSHHIRQVLLNLLGNAIKFTEQGEVQLVVTLKQESESAVTARFEVKDTGIGINPQALTKIFERFVQADQSTTRKYGGTGLGTTISKQLVELMGGSIGAESVLGRGSTFWVELPLLRDVSSETLPSPQTGAHDPDQRAICIVLTAAGHGDVTAILRSIGERHETVTSTVALAARIEDLSSAGVTIRAVIAACPIEQACMAFTTTVQRLPDAALAMIYIAKNELTVVDRARVSSIRGAYALEEATPRLISNAIHAASAMADGALADRADLPTVLKRKRVSLRILVAEDNATNQKIIQQLLEAAGHEVILTSDGEEALDRYETDSPDLAIFDFNMPEMSGVEAIRAIRMIEMPGCRMPAIILSASVTPEARQRAASAGADEFMGKPFDAAQLVHRIDRLAERIGSNSRKIASRTPRATRQTSDPWSGIAQAGARGRTHLTLAHSSLIDAARLAQLEDIARDASFLTELIAGFIGDVDGILAKTERAVAALELHELPDLMHSLKGAAVGVGATRLSSLAKDIETAQPVPLQMIKTKLAEIRSCFEATSHELHEYLAAHHHH